MDLTHLGHPRHRVLRVRPDPGPRRHPRPPRRGVERPRRLHAHRPHHRHDPDRGRADAGQGAAHRPDVAGEGRHQLDRRVRVGGAPQGRQRLVPAGAQAPGLPRDRRRRRHRRRGRPHRRVLLPVRASAGRRVRRPQRPDARRCRRPRRHPRCVGGRRALPGRHARVAASTPPRLGRRAGRRGRHAHACPTDVAADLGGPDDRRRAAGHQLAYVVGAGGGVCRCRRRLPRCWRVGARGGRRGRARDPRPECGDRSLARGRPHHVGARAARPDGGRPAAGGGRGGSRGRPCRGRADKRRGVGARGRRPPGRGVPLPTRRHRGRRRGVRDRLRRGDRPGRRSALPRVPLHRRAAAGPSDPYAPGRSQGPCRPRARPARRGTPFRPFSAATPRTPATTSTPGVRGSARAACSPLRSRRAQASWPRCRARTRSQRPR